MTHPAEIAAEGMEKRGGFWAVLPWLMMAAPLATQMIDRFRGGGNEDALRALQVPGFDESKPPGLGQMAQRYALRAAPHYAKPMFTRVAHGLHDYRTGV